ncbi:MAG TPA: hypothetical protein VKY26_12855, partial [Actinomycetota bacterium]|nr:hypothetical protein [Actinomycetota bacterium]
VADVYSTGMTVTETESVAPGVVFTGGLYPAQTPACSPTAPVVEGALSRSAAMAKVSGAYTAKLVRESDFAHAQNQTECGGVGDQNGCDPAVVTWAVATPVCGPLVGPPQVPETLPDPAPSPSSTGACWSITTVDAATGVPSNAFTWGTGPLPVWWGQLHDYSGDPTTSAGTG